MSLFIRQNHHQFEPSFHRYIAHETSASAAFELLTNSLHLFYERSDDIDPVGKSTPTGELD
jgi:hypothetical protein